MFANKNNNRRILDDIHPYRKKKFIETYLKGKGHPLEAPKGLPEEEAKRLMKEALTYAFGKFAE